MEIKLTKHFYLSEFTRSQTAERLGLDNNPIGEGLWSNLLYLCQELLEPVRIKLGVPLTISSGYRSPALNSILGGSKNSQHCKGEAADLVCNSKSNKLLFELIKEGFEFDQLIWEFGTDREPAWVHTSLTKGKNRKEVLRAKFDAESNKVIYYKI